MSLLIAIPLVPSSASCAETPLAAVSTIARQAEPISPFFSRSGACDLSSYSKTAALAGAKCSRAAARRGYQKQQS